jgi:primosomal protein N' (replication factor Y) (superfamily II helicase)
MYVQVILPLAIPTTYTYSVPEDFRGEIKIGIRVEVPLKQKLYSGIVYKILEINESKTSPRGIVSIIDQSPILSSKQLNLWEWIADYYCCSLGEVMQAALPSGLKLDSETSIILGDVDYQEALLSDNEFLIAEAVNIRGKLTIAEMQDILDRKTYYPILRSLLDNRVVEVEEKLIEKFSFKKIKTVQWNKDYQDEKQQSEALHRVAKFEKQYKTLLAVVELCKIQKEVDTSTVYEYADSDLATLKALAKKGIVDIVEKNTTRLLDYAKDEDLAYDLTTSQQEVVNTVLQSDQKATLIHGVTGSGKTQVYIDLIKKVIADDQQVLYILPEIALTSQIVDRLKGIFGNDLAVYHSRMSNAERVEVWYACQHGKKLFIGARSSVFLPFEKLGLIIVDEEHDASYKQQDPAPRYNARDVSLVIGKLYSCRVVLGSATPSLESYYNALAGKYILSTLKDRFGNAKMPKVVILNTIYERKSNAMRGNYSLKMLDAIQKNIDKGSQVILFQNRRGFAPQVQCTVCGYVADCINCDVKLTYHKYFDELRCHYCSYRTKNPKVCPSCQSENSMKDIGLGTEKVAEEIGENIQNAQITRLDLDTTKSKSSYEKILTEFANKKQNIMIGTQMVTKGFDFNDVTLIGVINADTLLYMPDFRTNERAMQLLTQVAGRAGRRAEQGKVVIQTSRPDHPVILDVIHHDYINFYEREITERRVFKFPPFTKLVSLEIRHREAKNADQAIQWLHDKIKQKLGNRVSLPITPSINRVKNQYIKQLLIKVEPEHNKLISVKIFLIYLKDTLASEEVGKGIRLVIDVDPY